MVNIEDHHVLILHVSIRVGETYLAMYTIYIPKIITLSILNGTHVPVLMSTTGVIEFTEHKQAQ